MDAVEGGDAVDAQAVDDVVAEQVALARGERDEGAAEGGAKLGAVAALQEGELGVGGVGDGVDVVDDGLAMLLAMEADGDPDRGDAEPRREAGSAVEVADARRAAVLADQEAQANELDDVVRHRALDVAWQGEGQGRDVLLIDEGDRAGVAAGACGAEIEVAGVELVDLVERDPRADVL